MKKLMLPLIVLWLVASCILYGEGERVLKPFPNVVTNFSYGQPFWLVSPSVWTEVFTAYATKTNTIVTEQEQLRAINALIQTTNHDARYIGIVEGENKRLRDKLFWKDTQIVLFTVGGIAVRVGFSYLIYGILADQVSKQ